MPQTAVAPVTPLTPPFPLIAIKGNTPSRFEAPSRLAKFGFASMFGGVINGTFLGVPNTNLQPGSETLANCIATAAIALGVSGFTAANYLVTFRVRAIFEMVQMTGSSPYAGGFGRTGGTAAGLNSVFRLDITSPALSVVLNPVELVPGPGTPGDLAYVDQTLDVLILGGATVTLSVDTKDSLQRDVRFHSPELHNINGITFPFPGWFNGQWCQIDVINAVPQ